MKIVEKYKCDVCGTEYKDRKDAFRLLEAARLYYWLRRKQPQD